MKSLVARVLLVSIGLLLAPACANGCSCETCMSNVAYEHHVRAETGRFQYEVSEAECWSVLRQLLSERGFALEDASPRASASTKPDQAAVAYDIRITRVDPKHFTLRLDRTYDVAIDGGIRRGSVRDLDLEWELLKRVEPKRAAEIERGAGAEAERGAQAGRGCDRGCATCVGASA